MATKTKNTKVKIYPNPPLVEVVCQFRFQLPPEHPWDLQKPGALLKALGKEYPNFEPGQEIGVGINFQDGKITPEILAPRSNFKFSDKSNSNSVIVTENSFTIIRQISKDNKYDWETFKSSVETTWEKAKGILKTKEFNQIGLRFVNHIAVTSDLSPTAVLSEKSEYFPSFVMKNNNGFVSKTEVALSANNNMIVTLATAMKGDATNTPSQILVIDIDRICTEKVGSAKTAVGKKLDSMHKEIEKVFFTSISDKMTTEMGKAKK